MTHERNFRLLNKKFREMFFPTLLASIAGNFAILVDALIVSILLGSLNLSVIQSIEPIAQFLNMIYWLIGFGGSILATTARARFDKDQANSLFTISLISITVIGLIITVFGLLFPDFFTQILCNSNELRPLVKDYFLIFIIVSPFMCFMIVLAYFIKTDDFIPLQFRAFLMANGLNVIGDLAFIPYLGIKGAALATTVSYIVASIYISTYFFNSKGTFRFVKVKLSKALAYMKDICKTGLSSCSIPLYQTIKLLVINSLILGIAGKVGLSAFNMCYNTQFLVGIFIFGTTQSILPIIAVYFQEGDYNGVDYVAKKSLKIVLGFGIFFTLLFAIFPQTILYLFSVSDPSAIPTALNAVRIYALSLLGYGINFLYIFYSQSVQYNKIANIVTILEGLIFPIPLAYVFGHFWGINGIWFSLVLTEIVTFIFIWLYSKYVTKKSNGQYSGFFLNYKDEEASFMEFTIPGNKEDAIALSKEIKDSYSNPNISEEVSFAIGNLIGHILDINEGLDWIDIIIRETNDAIFLSIKSEGVEFKYEEDFEGVKSAYFAIKDIVDNIEYSQILGLNNTVITINK